MSSSHLGGIGAGGPSSLAALQAQRAFAKPRTAPAVAPTPDDDLSSSFKAQKPITPDATANQRRPRLAYQEIQAIAQQAGYVGVSDQDIARAYTSNTSLLVDYRV